VDRKFDDNKDFSRSYFEYLESNPYLPVFWIDAKGIIFKVNNAVCRYLGYTREELINQNILFVDNDGKPESVLGLIDLLRREKINRFESRHRRRDGTLVDVEIISNYYCIDGTEFSFNYVFDITDRKNYERNLEKSVYEKTGELQKKIVELQESQEISRLNEEMFTNAFRTSQDAINLNDMDTGIYIQVNDGFSKIMGYPKEEVIGKSSLDLNIWKDPSDRARLVETVKKQGFCHNLEADFIRKDGTVVHGIMSASVQNYQGRKVLLNVSKDITKLKELENQLKELNSELQTRVDEEVAFVRKQQEIIFEQKKLADMGMMINAIAHQWRQPLNVIGLRTQDIADSYRENKLSKEYMDEFEEKQMSTVEFLSSTIEDFRTFFKPDGKESEFDAGKEVISLLKLIEIQMLAKGIKPFVSYISDDFKTEWASINDIPATGNSAAIIKGYRGEFKQVITNLVYNSIFAIEQQFKDHKAPDGFIHVKIIKTKTEVIIKIEDSGGGISNDIKPYIFNPFFTTKEDGKGTGLGLYLAKIIIHNHMNGSITVNNTKSGAEFEIIIPAV
jgi:PAS domain S-box-containing protein